MKKLHLSLLEKCNEKCLFCVKKSGKQGEIPTVQCLRVIYTKRKQGFNSLILDGGEPTLRPDLSRLAGAAISIGYGQVNIVTNGVLLSDANLVQKIAGCHPKALKRIGFCISLHSHKREISEKLTSSRGTFHKTLQGIRNVLDAGFSPVGVYHVITTLNYRNLPDFAGFLISGFKGLKCVTLSHIFPSGTALDNMHLYPRLSLVSSYFRRAVVRLKKAGLDVELSGCGMIPLCLLGGQEYLSVSQYLGDNPGNSVVYDSNKEEPFMFSSDLFNSANKVKPSRCRLCILDRICGGIWKVYAQKYGTGELKPLRVLPRGIPASAAKLGLKNISKRQVHV